VTPSQAAGAALPWLNAPLQAALREQRGHALLVHGAAGAGQLSFALGLARAWLCEGAPEARAGGLACGRCASCHLVQPDQVHPDLFMLLPEAVHLQIGWWQKDDEREKLESASRKPSEWIRIEQVRAAIEFATQTRSRALPKVIVIHPAERLQTIAASALLKLLEEPQGGLRIVLASADAASLLPTVRSRCQAIALGTPDPASAARWLQDAGLDDADVLLAAAGGQPLAALDRHAQGLDGALWRRLPALVAAGDAMPLARLPLPLAVECLQKLCHDKLAASAGAAPRFFPEASLGAPRSGLGELSAWGRSLASAARNATHPWNAPLLLESLLGEGKRALSAGGDSVHSRR
jgi:DNA polymerase III subunit delta'